MTDPTARNDSSLQSWLTNASSTRNQITQTVYDMAYTSINGIYFNQQNLRNRVSYSQVTNNAADIYPASATYYSYDIHGNVDTLLQDFGHSTGIPNAMNTSCNRFKKLVYNYDLISGKVNQVSYQPGQWDAYYQRYAYDAENRITDVYTGRDSVMLFLFPEREAHYTYYKHGPLARTELGQLRVQSLDYAYTLQGWLKGINPTMGGTLANGTDTTEAYPVAQDVYGFSLNYYNGDYKAIGYTLQSTSVLAALGASAAPLFNGNIAAMAVNIPRLGATKLYNYHYDQLNRIVAMDVFNGLNPVAGTFTPISVSDYQERTSYDPNGNILSYTRNGDAARPSMDNLSYFYKPKTNQLDKLTDAAADASSGNYPLYNDIKQGQSDSNYRYDAIGNLIYDASEGITGINWNVYGKITSITKSGTTINYVYTNLIKELVLSTAEQLWVSDITYIRTLQGFSYLSLITDAYSRRVVGYALYETLEAIGPLEALVMAVNGRIGLSPFILIHHSDRGVQYCSAEYIKILNDGKIAISMTQSGSPYDNALAERVNGTIKNDFFPKRVYQNHKEACKAVSKIIQIYNQKRPHASIDYLTPDQAHVKQGEIKKRWKNYSKHLKQKEGIMQVVE